MDDEQVQFLFGCWEEVSPDVRGDIAASQWRARYG
jgi:hypothetical protein